MTPTRSHLCAALALCCAASCSRKIEGPSPTVSAVAPVGVCQRQLDTTVTLTGAGLSPLQMSALVQGRYLELPTVTLRRALDLSGAAASGEVAFSGVPGDANADALRWYSQEQMSLTVTPGLGLEPGLWDLAVTNPNGNGGGLPGALLAVPPPSLTRLSQNLVCKDKPNALTVTGEGFIRTGSADPVVLLESTALAPKVSGCRALPGDQGYSSCTALDVDVPQGTLGAGTTRVTVRNPEPVQCVSETPLSLYVFDRPRVTSVQPLAICSQAANQQLVISGVGFLTVDGAAPVVAIGSQTPAATPSGCTAFSGPKETVQVCTTLTVAVPAGTFAPGSYPISVTNPAPVGCSTSETFTLVVAPPPVIADVQPRNVCSGSGQLTLTGTGFQSGATVTLNGTAARTVTVSGGGTTAVAAFDALPVGGPFTVALANGDGCSATAPVTVNVIPGPQLFFLDPAIVYNGITTQATLYGTGFAGAVQSVAMTPAGGGTAQSLTFTWDAARPNQVQVLIPKLTASGSYDFTLRDTSVCGATLRGALRVVDQATLALASPPVDPAFGWVGEPTAVTVRGTGFLAVPRLYLNPTVPGPSTVASAVGAVGLVDGTKLTALVPTPQLNADTSYDLIVVNPDGQVGFAAAAFRVTSLPPPTVASLSPGSVANTNPATFTINGKDFRTPAVTLTCYSATGAALATNPAAQVTGSSSTTISVSFDASAAGVQCRVRVTDGDNATYGDFSALVITNPAQNLYAPDGGPDLNLPRRAPATLAGDATLAARFLHVVGGDDGGTAHATVESSSLDQLGAPSPFFTQRERLTQARAFAGGATIGRYLYVAGGSDGTSRFDTVERAAVLDPRQREQVTDLLLEVSTTQGLDAGVWNYRVAAVMPAGDLLNPGGENLPSDPFPVRVPDLGSSKVVATVSWRTEPTATRYRVYRSVTAGAAVGTEQVIAEVNAPTTSFRDTGVATPVSTDTPLPVGSTGKWKVVATLSAAREGAAVSWGLDPSDVTRAYLYVLGGRSTATTALASYELLPLTLNSDGTQTVGSGFSAGGTNLAAARWQLSASRATKDLSSRIPAGTTYLYVLSGTAANGSTLESSAEAGLVTAGGQLSFTALQNLNRGGYATISAGNFVFALGGNNASPDGTIAGGEICGAGVLACGPVGSQVPPKVVNWNTGQNLLTPRFLSSAALSGAFIYLAGGVTSTAPYTVTRSLEYRLW